MIEIYTNHQITPEILNIIQYSEKYVVIVSPYIQLWEHLTLQLKSAIKRGVVIKWFYRTNEVKPKIINELKTIGVQMKNIDILHTKLYFSENHGIMTSMNLYEYSSNNSKEMGLYTDERKLLNKFKYYIEEELTTEPIIPKKSFLDVTKGLVNSLTSDVVEEKVEVAETNKSNKPTFKRTQSNGDGHCIRCSTSISYNMKSPYCLKHFKSWNKYKNPKFEEKHCHKCSKSHKTSFVKPICNSCYKS